MLMLPICLAALSPSRLPSALPTAPVAFEVSEPVMFKIPVSGVASVSTSWSAARRDRAARSGPADIGVLQNLRRRVVGLAGEVARRGAVGGVAYRGDRNRDRRQHDGAARTPAAAAAMAAIGAALTGARGDSQSSAFRLAKKDTATTALASRIVLRRNGRRIVPPD